MQGVLRGKSYIVRLERSSHSKLEKFYGQMLLIPIFQELMGEGKGEDNNGIH